MQLGASVTVTMNPSQEKAWRFFKIALQICAAAMYSLAYLLPRSIAEELVSWVAGSPGGDAIGTFLQRFQGYPSPSNAMLGLMAGWLLSPLLLLAGHRFMSDIVRTSGPRLSSRRKLITRALVGLPMLGIVLFTTVALAGKPSGRCHGCDSEPLFLMLTIYWIGMRLSGSMLGAVVSDVVAFMHRRGARPTGNED